MEANPATLLTAVMAALESQNKSGLKDALTRLIEKEAPAFDLGAWAKSSGGSATSSPASKGTPEEALDRYARSWTKKDATARQAALDALATTGPKEFDLSAWARKLHDQEFPLTLKAFKDLLDQDQLEVAIDALIERKPGADVLATAARSKQLKSYSAKKAEEARSFAKNGVMIDRWVFRNIQPKDNKAFWNELSVNGIETSPDNKEVVAVIIDGKPVAKTAVAAFIRLQLARAYVMEALASSKPPRLDAIDATVKSERERVLKTLEAKYEPGDA